MTTKIKHGWHWLAQDKRLRYNDKRLVSKGVPLSCEGKIELCNNGMHASPTIWEALNYAPGLILCKVRVSGEIVVGDNKFAGRSRTVVEWVDFSKGIVEYANWCAKRAQEHADAAWAARDAAGAAEKKAQEEKLQGIFNSLLKEQSDHGSL